jgi:hypothetical protein
MLGKATTARMGEIGKLVDEIVLNGVVHSTGEFSRRGAKGPATRLNLSTQRER